MLHSAVDIFLHAASNSVLVFCLCNLIIAAIFLTGKKSDSTHLLCQPMPVSSYPQWDCETSADSAAEPEEEEEKGSEQCREEADELRRRADEFIEKINQRWRAEKLLMARSVM